MNRTYHIDLTDKESLGTNDIIHTILKIRGIEDKDTFFNPPMPFDISLKQFGLDVEIEKICKRLDTALQKNESIVVYTDYDADGITGGAIMWETLHLLGFNVMPYVPHRVHEGYGFSQKGIDAIYNSFKPQVVVSVDHGIAAVDQIFYAKEKYDLDIIVTDHHAKQSRIPDAAHSIIHIPELSGSIVSYLVAKEIYQFLAKKKEKKYQLLEYYMKHDYVTYAAIGAVADLVPLVNTVRAIVKHGLEQFWNMKHPGLKVTATKAGIKDDRNIKTYEVGFIIAPRINAIGRLGHALDALRLLCTNDSTRSVKLANSLHQINITRQKMVQAAKDQAEVMLQNNKEDVPLIILRDDQWHEGIIGLIASEIVERMHVPVIVMTQGKGHLKGSARSLKGAHIAKLLEDCNHLLINHGGHEQAAGFSIDESKLSEFKREATSKASTRFKTLSKEKNITIDMKLPFSTITMELVESLSHFEPFGIGNPKIIVETHGAVQNPILRGDGKHLFFSLHDDISTLDMIAFGKGEQYSEIASSKDTHVIFYPDINHWNGKKKIQGKVISWY